MPISQLSSTDSINAGDQLALGSTSNGDDRRVAVSLLQSFMQASLSFATDSSTFTTQYSSPSATAFNVTIDPVTSNVHLILTPTATFATGTITLPAVAGVIDKQEILINCTQIVTTLTVDGNGATSVTGEPSTLSANDFFKLKYDLPNSVWYRVG